MARYNMKIKREKRVMTKPRRDAEIVSIGGQMSNVMFNLKQKFGEIMVTNHDRETYERLQKEWDAALIKYRQSFKRKFEVIEP
jgi:hypothetical protein